MQRSGSTRMVASWLLPRGPHGEPDAWSVEAQVAATEERKEAVMRLVRAEKLQRFLLGLCLDDSLDSAEPEAGQAGQIGEPPGATSEGSVEPASAST